MATNRVDAGPVGRSAVGAKPAGAHLTGGDRKPGRGGPPESSKTLDRGLHVLELLAEPGRAAGLTITELAGELGVGRPVVYRLVTTLEAHHLVVRQPGGRIRLGLGVRRLAAAVTPLVRTEALPVLQALADAVGATAHLTVAEGDEALALVVVEPTWTDFHVAYRSGARHRLDVGAAGRAILAGRAGDLGIIATDGEIQPGAHGLALPIRRPQPGDHNEVVVDASVGVVALQPLEPTAVAPALERAAQALAAILR